MLCKRKERQKDCSLEKNEKKTRTSHSFFELNGLVGRLVMAWRPLRSANILLFAVIAGYFLIDGALVMSGQAQVFPFEHEHTEGEAILSYERSLRLSDHPDAIVWSPDNQHIAVKGFNSGRLAVFDITGAADGWRTIADKIGGGHIAWAPDGRSIAVNQLTPFTGFRLFSIETGQETFRREYTRGQPYEGCAFAGQPLVFERDGLSLWVDCAIVNATEPFTFALRVSSRDFTIQDRIIAVPPISGGRSTSWRFVFSQLDNRLRLSAIFRAHTDVKDQSGRIAIRNFGYGFDLDRKLELFQPFEVATDRRSGFFRDAQELLIFPNPKFALVRLATAISTRPGVVQDVRLDRLFEMYDTGTGNETLAFGGIISANPEGGVVTGAVLTPNAHALIGTWSRSGTRRGGLVVFDPRTGAVRQRVTGSEGGSMALSPDGKRVARATVLGELRIYRCNQ